MNCCEQHAPYGCEQGRDCPVRAARVASVKSSTPVPWGVTQSDKPAPPLGAPYWTIVAILSAVTIFLVLGITGYIHQFTN